MQGVRGSGLENLRAVDLTNRADIPERAQTESRNGFRSQRRRRDQVPEER
jgi:hypothetical protein